MNIASVHKKQAFTQSIDFHNTELLGYKSVAETTKVTWLGVAQTRYVESGDI